MTYLSIDRYALLIKTIDSTKHGNAEEQVVEKQVVEKQVAEKQVADELDLSSEAKKQEVFEKWKHQMPFLYRQSGRREPCNVCLKFPWECLSQIHFHRKKDHKHWKSLEELADSSKSCALCAFMWARLELWRRQQEKIKGDAFKYQYSVESILRGSRLTYMRISVRVEGAII